MGTFESEVLELEARIKEVLAARIEGMATSRYDIQEERIASLASHWGALQAVRWFKSEHKFD